MSTDNFYVVHQVLGSDSLIVRNKTAELNVRLPFISVRDLGPGKEYFQFKARELLRLSLVSKRVQLNPVVFGNSATSANAVSKGSKRITAIVSTSDGQDVGTLLVKDGLAKVDGSLDNGDYTKYIQTLVSAEQNAKEKAVGIYDTNTPPTLKISHDQPEKLADFAGQFQNQQLDAIVEQVRDADSLRLRLLLAKNRHQFVNVLLAGIRCPKTFKKPADDAGKSESDAIQEREVDPLGRYAQQYVEARLLQRQVKVTIVGTTQNQNALIASVLHPVGNIAEFLLRDGLARVVDWQAALMDPKDMGKLREAERAAQAGKLNIWRDLKIEAKPASKEENAIVYRIYSADSMDLLTPDNKVKRIFLSSLRSPRSNVESEAPFVEVAKEFVRKLAIGKRVKFVEDYEKPANDNFPARSFYTVTIGDKNLAREIVKAGYSYVMTMRKDDLGRSPIFDELIALEREAIAKKIGIFATKKPVVPKIIEVSENAARAKQFLASFKRQERINGIVDFVISASRFKIYIPRDNAKIVFSLSDVRTPRSSSKSSAGESFGDEAQEFVARRLTQRDVELRIDSIDKNGAFIGTLYFNKKENLAFSLLQEGLAYLSNSAINSSEYRQLADLEKAAQEAGKGIFSEKQLDSRISDLNVKEEPAETTSQPKCLPFNGVASHFEAKGLLYVQNTNLDGSNYESIQQKLRSTIQRKSIAAETLKANKEIAVFDNSMNSWFRARVSRVERVKSKLEAFCYDTGRTVSVQFEDVAALPETLNSKAFEPKATAINLAFLQFPVDYIDFEEDYSRVLESLVSEKTVLSICMETGQNYKAAKDALVFLSDKAQSSFKDTINYLLIVNGLAYITKRINKSFLNSTDLDISELREAQNEASKCHRGIWQYGDITEDE